MQILVPFKLWRGSWNSTDKDGGQICRTAPGDPGRHWVGCEMRACSGSEGRQQHPRLLWHSLSIRQVIISMCTELAGLSWAPAQFGLPIRKTQIYWTEFGTYYWQGNICLVRRGWGKLLFPPGAEMTSGGEGSSPQHLQGGRQEGALRRGRTRDSRPCLKHKHLARYKKKPVSWWEHVHKISMVTYCPRLN